MLNDRSVIKTCGGIAVLLTVEYHIGPVLVSGGDSGGVLPIMHAGIMVDHTGVGGLLEGLGGGPVLPVMGVLDLNGIGPDLIQSIGTDHLEGGHHLGGRKFSAVSPVGRKLPACAWSYLLGIGRNGG